MTCLKWEGRELVVWIYLIACKYNTYWVYHIPNFLGYIYLLQNALLLDLIVMFSHKEQEYVKNVALPRNKVQRLCLE